MVTIAMRSKAGAGEAFLVDRARQGDRDAFEALVDTRLVDRQADLEAIAVSVGIAAEAAYEAAGCPDTGRVEILSDPIHWSGAFTIGGDEINEPGCPCSSVQRLHFASIGYASHPHLLVVALQSYGPTGDVDAAMAGLQAAAQPILDSLIAPAIVVDN